ncbi:hypothetical protein EX30DRAFT_372112 [Ascodesmis nigricans]|uniref:RNA-binding domain-containing protein n=1 Tax=Ascodesmis nigricans TaxID=341454 RepID=A0A4S2MVB4_9PEZI|nr:hypothetical protein EX30DRAFT_372112 [Ascodesmis nigricans]
MRELVEGLGLSGVEKMTLIRDRRTGTSRGFGFVHFSTTKDSMAFIDRFGPTVRLGEDRCRIAFSKERDDNERRRRRDEDGEEWRCRVCLLVNYPRRHECFRCQTPRSDVTATGTLTHPTPTHFTNDGERDMATSPPSQFLLFRHLEPTVTEEILSKGVLKLAAPISPDGASEHSIRRVLLVRDRITNESWRYGFAEFSSSQEAQKALTTYEKNEKFTISSKPVSVSYIHPGVFVPVYNAAPEAERFTFLPLLGAVGLRLAYWDEEGYVSELALQSAPELAPTADQTTTKSTEKKAKKRKADASASSTTDNPHTTKKPAAHLQFWQNRHSELHGLPRQQPNQDSKQPSPPSSSDPTGPSTSTTAITTTTITASTLSPTPESFADLTKLACLLCSRMFKTAEKLHEHERVSSLHAGNIKNEKLVATARAKLQKASGTGAGGNNTAAPAYRDRAKERRQVFGNSNTAPTTAGTSSSTSNTAGAPNAKRPSPTASSTNTPGQDDPATAKPNLMSSKGAALLGKMGWSQGQGLGASGSGRTEHVVAEVYTAGAGLGMQGAKVGDVEEAAKKGAGSYGEFVMRTREKAKERYEGMG